MSIDALADFHARYQRVWQQSLGHDPVSTKLESSPIETGRDEQGNAFWQAQRRSSGADFSNIAAALELELHPALTEFYGHFWAGSLQFDADFGQGELLQVWNEDDFAFLQENLIGHLLMKQKLKQAPTLFIGTIDHDMLVLSNTDGSVWLEVAGQEPHQRVAGSLSDLFVQLRPVARYPEAISIEPESALSLSQRFKIMLGHLGLFKSK